MHNLSKSEDKQLCGHERSTGQLDLPKNKTLTFARDYKAWTLKQWTQVMWSNESRLTLSQSDGWPL